MNVKIQRINSDILKVLSTTLTQKMGNEALADVMILSVDTAADMSIARILVDIKGDEIERQKIMAELERASGMLRNEIASRVKMRQIPNLRFILDKGRANAERVEELLAQINGGKS